MTQIDGNIQQRYDTAANFAASNRVLLAGEKAIESDTLKEKVGNGTTVYNALPYSFATQITAWAIVAKNVSFSPTSADSGKFYIFTGNHPDFTLPSDDPNLVAGDTVFRLMNKCDTSLSILGSVFYSDPTANPVYGSLIGTNYGQFIEIKYIGTDEWIVTSATGVWAAA